MAKKSKTVEDKRKWGGIISGVILIFLGIVFLLNNLGFTSLNLGVLWPIFLIIPGVFMLFGHNRHN